LPEEAFDITVRPKLFLPAGVYNDTLEFLSGSVMIRIPLHFVVLDYSPVTTRHEVTIPRIEHVWSDPVPGTHYCQGGHDYLITFTPEAGYSLKKASFTTTAYLAPYMAVMHNSDGTVTLSFHLVHSAVTFSVSGVEPTSSTSNAVVGGVSEVKVWSDNGSICFNLAETTDVTVYSITGTAVYNGALQAGEMRVSLPRGIYIVRTGDKVQKIRN
jgi:hypothetical protein